MHRGCFWNADHCGRESNTPRFWKSPRRSKILPSGRSRDRSFRYPHLYIDGENHPAVGRWLSELPILPRDLRQQPAAARMAHTPSCSAVEMQRNLGSPSAVQCSPTTMYCTVLDCTVIPERLHFSALWSHLNIRQCIRSSRCCERSTNRRLGGCEHLRSSFCHEAFVLVSLLQLPSTTAYKTQCSVICFRVSPCGR